MPAWLEWLAWWRPPFLHRLCVIVLISDPETPVRGVLWARRGAWLTVRQAALIKANADKPLPMDGEIVIHRTNVAFIQVVP